MCSACRLMVFNVCVKFHEIMSSSFKVMELFVDTKIFNTQRTIIPKVGKPELRFMCFACRLIAFKVCMKFHKKLSGLFNLWSGHENC